MSEVQLLGIRHHGPGSARAVRRALAAFAPGIVLIEGPPEADALVRFAADDGLRPPVALLAYPVGGPGDGVRTASFWPFAEFSPEWQAMRWAVRAGVPVRFCDAPASYRLAVPAVPPDPDTTREDPIGALAAAAGYDDPERWWEDVVEHRLGEADAGQDELTAALAPFAAIGEAMAQVRAATGPLPEAERLDEQRREAHMRTVLRAAVREHERVAVVCGAWHVPALAAKVRVGEDTATLRGLPKVKTAVTWVPWTHGRLASWRGYGAGVRSPGWYHHLFTAPDRPVTRWLVEVAHVLRAEGVPASSAHVLEAVRLADALATLRGRPLAGLAEVTEATRAVLCEGDELRLDLVNRVLVVGERLGEVPDDAASVPLAKDLAAAQRRLRLPPQALVTELDLDLRKDYDLERSRLLHRLRLLGIEWGALRDEDTARRGKGTFWESWQLCWRPEFAVDLVEASAYGTTVPDAATRRTGERAAQARSLADVTGLVEGCLLADLATALPAVLRALDEKVALDADVTHLMDALPALARSLRYGDVRGTDVSALRTVTDGLVTRICVGLPGAVTGLDDDAAQAVSGKVDAVHAALGLLADPEPLDRWLGTLLRLADRTGLPGLLGGRLTRLLLDSGRLDNAEVGRRMGLVLTVGTPVPQAAAWIEGFLSGGGLLLVHDQRLLGLVDAWLTGVPADTFVEVLPLLRRTFGTFAQPERRAVGERVRAAASGSATHVEAGVDVDDERGALVLPTVALLLGRQLEVAR